MKITLIAACFNSSETLRQSLSSINNIQKIVGVELNVVYIDNNSTDGTAQILREFSCIHAFTVLKQTKKGKNSALNTIFDFPSLLGELLIFTDDDVIFPNDFLRNYALLADKWPKVAIFGGRVEAKWPFEPNPNLLAGVDKVVAFVVTPEEWGYESGAIDPVKIHGPNMALRRRVFEDGLRFDESIGPNGGNYMMGSETALLYRLRNMGHSAVFDFDNVVQHMITPNQLSASWLRARANKAGRSMVMHQQNKNQFKPVAELFGFPRWALLQMLKHFFISALARSGSLAYYRSLWKGSHLTGYCREYKNTRKKFSCG